MSTIKLPVSKRIVSIDILRGIIMAIMLLDHVRDYFTDVRYDPLDLSKTTAPLFLTRWITHFCAPTFIFLSGMSVYISLSKGKSVGSASIFLVKRGLALIFFEILIMNFAWQFDLHWHLIFLQVIWVIGWSMLILAALIHLQPKYVGLVGLGLIFSHNLLDGVHLNGSSLLTFFWGFLHQPGLYKLSDNHVVLLTYPIIPWCGVMAAGYGFAPVLAFEEGIRRRVLIKTGLGAIALFLILRAFNIYGDPHPWNPQDTWWKDILDFIKCEKYPPSLLYLLMTLGTSICLLARFERTGGWLEKVFAVFGQVPMFYYIVHAFAIHLTQLLVAFLTGYPITVKALNPVASAVPKDWGFSLPVVYLIAVLLVTALYFPCRWYKNIKKTRKDWWLSYV